MSAVIFSFTRNGGLINLRVARYLEKNGFKAASFSIGRYANEAAGLKAIEPSLKEMCRNAFEKSRLLVFIGAAGIAVRSIAPFIKSKKTDPAVVVIDEQGKFVIPLLSGHIGGANRLADGIAGLLGSVSVVTTATDVNGLFAVDEWGAEHKMLISNMDAAKEFASVLVDGGAVGVKSEFPVSEPLPKGMAMAAEGRVGVQVALSSKTEPAFKNTVLLQPHVLHIGIGCRRNTPVQAIKELVFREFDRLGFDLKMVAGAASIDVKKDEQGLLAFADEYKIPISFYSADELNAVQGDFTPSRFVAKTVGVDNVCERAAVLNSGNGNMLLHKTSLNGVTLAIAVEAYVVDFCN